MKRAWVSADLAWEYSFLAVEARGERDAEVWRATTRRQARARDEAAARIRAAAPALTKAQQRLAALAATEEFRRWGYLAGLRAIADLVHAFDPELDSCALSPERATQVRSWLQTAMTAEPEEPRWVAAASFFGEALDDVDGAAACMVRQRDLAEASSARVPSLLRPEEGSTRQAGVSARRPSTYHAAFMVRKDAGDWAGAAGFAYGYLLTTLAQSWLEMEATPAAAAVACMREAIAGMCGADDLGWAMATLWLDFCREAVTQPPPLAVLATGMDLTPQLDAIKQDIIAPRRTAFERARAAHDREQVERSAARFARLHGIRSAGGVVRVRGHRGTCQLQDARATVTVRTPAGRRAALLRGRAATGDEVEVRVTITGPRVRGRGDGRCRRWRRRRASMGGGVQYVGRQQ